MLVDSPLFPSFLSMILSIEKHVVWELGKHLVYSSMRTFVGLAWGMVLGIPLGFILGQVKIIDRFIGPLLYLTYPFPKVILVPILILLLGIGDLSKISLIAMITFYQMAVTAKDAASNIPRHYFTAFYSLGGKKLQAYRYVVLPACLPKLFTCTRISLSTSLALLFFTETYATSEGIGYFVWDAFARYDYNLVYLGSASLCLLGFGSYLLIDLAESIWAKWSLDMSR